MLTNICFLKLYVLTLDEVTSYFLSNTGRRCDRDIITIDDCKMAASSIGGAIYVEVRGDGNQLPHGCVWDNVTPGQIYVYWNKIGGVKSLDPKIKIICEH